MAGGQETVVNVTGKKTDIYGQLSDFKCKFTCCNSCSYRKRAAAKERLKSRYCSTEVIKICERCFLFRSLKFCPKCHKCSSCCSRSTRRG